jgi:GDP-4-dehydro-6-deoxy-D-mannose reductase
MKKILITGITGFVGEYLAEHVSENGNIEIFGTYLSDESKKNFTLKDKVTLLKVDLTKSEEVESIFKRVQPDEVYHLAAKASVAESFIDPIHTLHNNIDSEVFLFEAILKANLLNTKVLVVSSSEVYGIVKQQDLPVNEEVSLHPANPYAVSKIAQDYLAFQYFISKKIPIIRIRPFNHIGPRQGEGFVVSSFAKQIASIEKGLQQPIMNVGNLDAKRDFTDVRDIVKAYTLILERGELGDVYNIGSGKSHSISEILDILVGFSKITITKKQDEALMRPSDLKNIVCDNTKIRKKTGWKPNIPLEQSLQDILDYWRSFT